MNNAPYFFLHIPKSGGSTVATSLRLNLGREGYTDFVLSRDSSWRTESEALLRSGFGGGHQVFGMHRLLKYPLSYFTILRDPLQRQISHYWYAYNGKNGQQNDRKDYCYYSMVESDVRQGNISINEWLESSYEGQNIMTHMLCGYNVPNEYRLALAKQNLKERFTCFGFCEDMSQFLLLLCASTGLKLPYYFYTNKTAGKESIMVEPDQKAREKFINDNTDDYELYNFAKKQLFLHLTSFQALYDEAIKVVKMTQNKINQLDNQNLYSDNLSILDYSIMANKINDIVNSIDQTAVINFCEAYRTNGTNKVISQHIGNVDGIMNNHVYGWAVDLNNPSRPIRILVEDERGNVIASGQTCEERLDVFNAGYCTSRAGFLIALPATYTPFRVRIEESHEPIYRNGWWRKDWHCS